MIHIMFVCLGNICRSPMADAVMQHLISEAGLSDSIHVDSSGTSSYHVGEPPHPGTQQILKKHNISYQHRSQKTRSDHLDEADYVVAMDQSNLNALRRMAGQEMEGKLSLLLDHAVETGRSDVPDPYYEGGFDTVYQLVLAGCQGLLDRIRRENNL